MPLTSSRPGVQLLLIDAGGGEHSFLGFGGNPRWSPDATRIAALALPLDGGAFLGVWDLGGSGDPRLVVFQSIDGPPSWSSDGTELLYAEDDIYRVSVNGGTPVQLTTDPARDWDPDWR